MRIIILVLTIFISACTSAESKDALNKPFSDRTVPDWTLPASFDTFTVTQSVISRLDTGEVTYKLRINAHVPTANMVGNVQLIAYPHDLIIDKSSSVGVYVENSDAKGVDIYMETGGRGQTTPYKDGLYLLNIDMMDGTKVEGWFVLEKVLAPPTPVFLTPYVGQRFVTGNPTLTWTDFFSSDYISSEKRNVYVRVYNQHLERVWAAYQGDADETEITVGQAESQEGVNYLSPGDYDAHIIFRELHKFGSIWLGREYRTITPFSVQ